MYWYLTVVLIYFSLVTNDAERLFMCLLVICTYSFLKCLFKSFAYWGGHLPYYWVLGVLYVFWIQVLFQKYVLRKSPDLWFTFSFLKVSFWEHKVLILIRSIHAFFVCVQEFFWLPQDSPVSSRCFVVLAFTCRCKIHFQLKSCVVWGSCQGYFLLHVRVWWMFKPHFL